VSCLKQDTKIESCSSVSVRNRTLKVLFLKQDTINRVLFDKQDLVGNAWRRLGLKKKGGITFKFPSSRRHYYLMNE
jgi:hypothetical protein